MKRKDHHESEYRTVPPNSTKEEGKQWDGTYKHASPWLKEYLDYWDGDPYRT